MDISPINKVFEDVGDFAQRPNAFRALLLLLLSMLIAYWFSHFLAKIIIRIARVTARRSDAETDEVKKLHLRRLETHLSVAIAMVRAFTVGIVAFYVWQIITPSANLSTAAVGASAFFIVIAGATLGMVLRDITAGSAMIIERWFDVGDFIRVEPFLDVNGVVERMTLRSTKIRSLNGEVNWMHNQYMQSVKVTPGGLRTIAIDVFAKDEDSGRNLSNKVVATIPVGPLTVTKAPKVITTKKWSEGIWLLTVIATTPPGREWLMESYFVDSLRSLDSKNPKKTVLVRQPIVRYADPAAERSFKRAVRHNKELTD